MLHQQLDRPPDAAAPQLLAAGRAGPPGPPAGGTGGPRDWRPTRPGYPCSEQVQPWIRATIEKADEQRRLGEDRLFSRRKPTGPRPRSPSPPPSELYQRGRGDVRPGAGRADARDRLLAGLPDYSRWLAHRHPDDLLKDDLSASFGELWNQAHKLAEQLEIRGRGRRGRQVLERDRAVASRFERARPAVRRPDPASSRATACARTAQAATAAAAVPFSDARDLTLRNAIWDRLETIQKHDLRGGRQGRDRRALRGDRKQAAGLLAPPRPDPGIDGPGRPGRALVRRPEVQGPGPASSGPPSACSRPRTRTTRPRSPGGRRSPPPARRSAAAGSRSSPRSTSLDRRGQPLDGNSRSSRTGSRGPTAWARLIDGGAAPLPESGAEATAPGPPDARPRPPALAGGSKLAGPLVRRGSEGRQALLPGRRAAVRRRRRQARARRAPTVARIQQAPRRRTTGSGSTAPSCSPSPASGART